LSLLLLKDWEWKKAFTCVFWKIMCTTCIGKSSKDSVLTVLEEAKGNMRKHY
jgi:hypothetical protein